MLRMSTEGRKDCRFYVTLFCAMALAGVGTFTPPVGELADSLLWAFFGLLATDCAILGIDVKGILAEIAKIKSLTPAQQDTTTKAQDTPTKAQDNGEVVHN